MKSLVCIIVFRLSNILERNSQYEVGLPTAMRLEGAWGLTPMQNSRPRSPPGKISSKKYHSCI